MLVVSDCVAALRWSPPLLLLCPPCPAACTASACKLAALPACSEPFVCLRARSPGRLCERQTGSGGLNGRPQKLQDVCYSWWCLSALSILGRLHWIDQPALADFILECQASCLWCPVPIGLPAGCRLAPTSTEPAPRPPPPARDSRRRPPPRRPPPRAQDEEGGGISDRPEDQADVYHTFFGIAGLSLLGRCALEPIDPTFALPTSVVARLRAARGQQAAGGEQEAAGEQAAAQQQAGEQQPQGQPA